jgi:hypothetical protein
MGTSFIGVSSEVLTFVDTSQANQGVISNANGVVVRLTPPSGLGPNDILAFQVRFPPSGTYKVYLNTSGTGTTMIMYNANSVNMSGTVTNTLSNFTLPETSGVGGNLYYILYSFGPSFTLTSNTMSQVFRIGLNGLNTLASYIVGGTPTNLLTLGTGESFTVTTTGMTIVLNRIFNTSTAIPLFQFTALAAGNYQVTSSNTFVIANDPSPTSFIAGQDMADTVIPLNTTTTATPVTLTVTFANIGVETAITSIGYII